MNGSSGGAATNSGIDYQQRVAAFFTLAMALKLDCSNVLERSEANEIHGIAYETADAIDDVVLTHTACKTFLQVKRKLSLSEQPQSDFFKTIDQFVRQSLGSRNPTDCYAIVTTPDTSKKITSDLRKITTSARLNTTAAMENPLTLAEQAAYDLLVRCIERAFLFHTKTPASPQDIQSLLRKTYIITLDIEHGSSYEKAFLLSISHQLNTAPELLWGYVRSKTLDWSRQRQSISLQGVRAILDRFRGQENDGQPSPVDSLRVQLTFDPEKYDICAGREVVLIRSFIEDFDLQLLEFYRFDDQGDFRLRFHENTLELGDGSHHPLLARFSTFSGAERFLLDQPLPEETRLMLGPMNSERDEDATPLAVAYGEKIRRKLLENTTYSKCIHCDAGLSEHALAIEIQECELPFDAGFIHKDCLRPSDRVLGVAANPGMTKHPELKNFDYQRWFFSLDRSQAVWNGSEQLNQAIKHMWWNNPSPSDTQGKYCIKVRLEDGSLRYVQQRGKVQRFDSEEVATVTAGLNELRESKKAQGNPLCYSADGSLQAVQADIEQFAQHPLDLIECLEFQSASYTRGISQLHDRVKNFYTPLAMLTHRQDRSPLTFDNALFLTTSPFELKQYLKNWLRIGFSPSAYTLDIIERDEDFDRLMQRCGHQGIQVVVDPLFDSAGKLMKGCIVVDKLDSLEPMHEQDAQIYIFAHPDGAFRHIYYARANDLALMLCENCQGCGCGCMGCQLQEQLLLVHGQENLQVVATNSRTVVVTVDDSEFEWDEAFIADNAVDWQDWKDVLE
ncbi:MULTISPECIES: hypothetical protein [unclassified Pseudomonas]|uniref:hypothetical protein n=1 Tax=unclassified Pseudomonas TaxID=196821 RepID=UPI002447EC13|nr:MULTISPECIES: hypothetical protein [unclassified Pseudomonas]MDH0301528.1 hypothetical protein [Pseudomonas sp. GD04091]MDH1985422.1 hypothetical protein [Pseudomonas sp. GD03689]